MCRHILNAKVFVQASCCLGWYDCPECHDEVNDHLFKTNKILRLTCKSCKRTFQKDLLMLMNRDKYCEQCKVQWCVPGKKQTTKQTILIFYHLFLFFLYSHYTRKHHIL